MTKKTTAPKIKMVKPTALTPTPGSPSERTTPKRMKALVDSIREFGILNPLRVECRSGKLFITDGHRRRQAAITLGLTEVPVLPHNA